MSDIYAIVFMAVFAGFCVGIVFAPRPKRKRKRKPKHDEMPEPFGRVCESLGATPEQYIQNYKGRAPFVWKTEDERRKFFAIQSYVSYQEGDKENTND